MVNKNVVTLSQHLQCIMLCIHQYRAYIFYKPGLELYIADWLCCHNQTQNVDQEITGMNIITHVIKSTVHIPLCTLIEDIRATMKEDTEVQMLKQYIIEGWPHTKDKVEPHKERYWLVRHEFIMIHGTAMKGK